MTDYRPILEQNGIPHNRKGLLTRRQLTEGPEFAMTLDKAEELDGFHVVFGTVLEGMSVLDAIAELPTYSYKTRTGTLVMMTLLRTPWYLPWYLTPNNPDIPRLIF